MGAVPKGSRNSMEQRKIIFTVRIPATLRDAAKAKCKAEGRDISKVLRLLLERWLQVGGI